MHFEVKVVPLSQMGQLQKWLKAASYMDLANQDNLDNQKSAMLYMHQYKSLGFQILAPM